MVFQKLQANNSTPTEITRHSLRKGDISRRTIVPTEFFVEPTSLPCGLSSIPRIFEIVTWVRSMQSFPQRPRFLDRHTSSTFFHQLRELIFFQEFMIKILISFLVAAACRMSSTAIESCGIRFLEDNSFFTRDFGAELNSFVEDCEDEDMKEKVLLDAVKTIAAFHIDATRFVEELKAIGMEDTSLQKIRNELPHFVSELHSRSILDEEQVVIIKNLVPEMTSMLDTLMKGTIPLTVCHGDLNSSNITEPSEEDGSQLLFDWYASSVSYPLMDMWSGSFGESSYIEVYVSRWRKYGSEKTLMELLSVAKELTPLWDTYLHLKMRNKTGHKLDAETEHDFCVFLMKDFIDSLRTRKGAEGDEVSEIV